MSDSTASKPESSPLSPAIPAAVRDAKQISEQPAAGDILHSQPPNGSTASSHSFLTVGESVAPDDATVISDRVPEAREAPGTGSSPVDLGRMLEGERLDHFELDKFIGGGGMGAVFRGSDTALGRTVAIKVLLRRYGSDEETIRRFQNEAQSAARLDHENIARVYYVGEDRGWHYIVLEYIEGENIRDLVNLNGPFSLQDTVSYTLQISDALEHASSRDVVHRDIKPSNVLVGGDGRAKLVDMGLARLHQVDQSQEDLTASGVTLGTFDYISPEQARDPRSADVRSDLYSLGCTVFFMLTGQPPFPEGTVLQKLLRHQGVVAPDPREIRPELPDAICQVTKKLLSKKPHDRYQSPLELSAELLMISDELNLRRPPRSSSVVMTTAPAEASWAARHLPWIVPTALLLIIALIVQYTGSGQPEMVPFRPAVPVQESPDGDRIRPDESSIAKLPENNGDPAPDSSNPVADGNEGTRDSSASGAIAKASDSPETDGGNTERPGAGDIGDSGATSTPEHSDVAGDNNSSQQGTESADPMPADSGTAAKAGDDGTRDPGAAQPLVVDGKGGTKSTYATLADACREAASGSVIELNYSGRLPAPENPILLAQRKLTIRAGDGSQPVVRFRPEGPDRVLYPRSMINVAGGELTLSNIRLELEIPAHARSEDWTLFEAVLADEIRLERCTLTIRNAADDLTARYRNVSFFHIKSAPHRERPATAETAEPLPRMNIELRNCIARGEAIFLRGNALFTVQLQWENGLLATTERFVEIEAQATALPEDSKLEIDLQHVTAMMGSGFCRMTSRDDERRLTPMRVDCTDSILITNDAPLLEQSGPGSLEDFRRLLHWNADRSFYEHFSVFWRIDSVSSTMISDWDWIAWQEHWGPSRERTDRPLAVLWQKFPAKDNAISNHTRSDYVLAETENNPARAAATDGVSNAGLQAKLLPQLSPSGPELPSSEPAPETDPLIEP